MYLIGREKEDGATSFFIGFLLLTLYVKVLLYWWIYLFAEFF